MIRTTRLEILRLHVDGVPATEIAERVGYSVTQVYRVIRQQKKKRGVK